MPAFFFQNPPGLPALEPQFLGYVYPHNPFLKRTPPLGHALSRRCVRPFGSSANGFAIKDSDLDVTCFRPRAGQDGTTRDGARLAGGKVFGFSRRGLRALFGWVFKGRQKEAKEFVLPF